MPGRGTFVNLRTHPARHHHGTRRLHSRAGLPIHFQGDTVVDIATTSRRFFRAPASRLQDPPRRTAVRENKGNKTLAARSLCISRAYLHRLIRLAEVDPMFDHETSEMETA